MSSFVRFGSMVALMACVAAPVGAQEPETTLAQQAAAAAAQVAPEQAGAAQEGSAPPAVAVEYSDAYRTRAKIHRIASFATLPLFATEGFVGQSLYNNPSDGKKSAHLAVATGIGVLFGVNTVTGVWNLVEARHDPNHSTRRWVHGLLMLGADGGFLATAATGPSRRAFFINPDDRSMHRTVAFTSIGLASAGYLIMLFGGH